MTIQAIPTSSTPFYSQTTTLEGVGYLLSFAYSEREQTWSMSLADANGVDVYNGMKLICSTGAGPNPLLWKCRDPRRPPGDFLVLSGTQDVSPPGLLDLVAGAGRCALYYVTSDVLALLAAGGIETYLAELSSGAAVGTGSTYGQR